MKHRLQTFLKHKLQWLVLLTALLGVSQGVWGYDKPETIDQGINIQLKVDGVYQWLSSDGMNRSGVSAVDLGSVSSVVVSGGWVKIRTWTNSGTQYCAEVGSANFIWADNSSFSDSHNNDIGNVDDRVGTWGDNYINRKLSQNNTWYTYNTPGTYTIYFKCEIGGKYCEGWGDCNSCSSASNAYVYNNGGTYYQVTFTIGTSTPTIVGSDGWNNKSWEMSESGTNLVSKSIYIPIAACNYQFKIKDGSNYYGWSNCSSSTKTHANIVEGSDGNIKICTNSPSFGGAIATVTYNTSTHDIDISLQDISSITIHMKNDVNWSPVKIYSWFGNGGEGQKCSGGWSGTEMTGGSGSGTWYSYSTNSCLPEKVIFNNNNGSQTGNITLEYPFCYSVTGTGDNNWTLTTCPCSKPAASFTTVTAQLNATDGSPWAGVAGNTSTAASGGYFADEHRTITLTETNGSYAYYQWEVSTDNGSNYSDISGASSASSSYTAPLPGTYKFRCKAGCSSSDYSTSGTITVNVPYPSIGIEGPGIKGCAAWTPSYASGSGLMSRSELTWSGTVTVNATGTSDGAFIIIQQYKNGVTSGSGWASCTEDGTACSGTCDGDDIKGNTVNKDCKRNTLTNLDRVSGGNYYFNSDKFAADQQVKITVTMTAYNTYTVTACLIPQSMSINGPLQACVNDQSLTALEVTATATSPSYQWQSCSTADGDYADISGANSYTYTPDKSASAKYYRCAVTACGTTVNSDHKQYTIYGASVAGSIAQKTTGTASPLGICKDATAILKLTGNTGSIQWQKYNSSTSQFENESGATSSEYTTTAKNATGTDYYRAAVTNGTCATAYTATTTGDAFQVISYNSVNAGTVTLTPSEVCVGDDSQATVDGEYLAGGIGAWSAGSGASIDSDGSIETSSSGTPSITYTISSYKCPGTASANATLTVKATPSFSINADPASGYTAWKPITLSTSPTQTGAVWSITTNHSESGDATSVGYLSATSGSGTVFKGPAPASSGSNTFVVQATVTDGSSGCSKSVTKNVAVSYEDCE